MPILDPQVALHHPNIKLDAKPVKQQQWRFSPYIMEVIKIEVHKLIECSFIWEEQHPDWVANISMCSRKMRRSEFALTSMLLTQPVLRINFHYPSLMSWSKTRVASKGCPSGLTICVASKECPSWMAFQGTIKSRCTRMTRSIRHFECHWGYIVTL